jgi:hypothetical protein
LPATSSRIPSPKIRAITRYTKAASASFIDDDYNVFASVRKGRVGRAVLCPPLVRTPKTARTE